MPAPDRRTVAELPADRQRLAREAMLEVSADQGPAMGRTWGQVVHAAAQLWNVLPAESLTPRSIPDAMSRLRGLGNGIARSVSTGGWPGTGPLDQGLLEVSLDRTQATVQIEHAASSIQPASPDAPDKVTPWGGQVIQTLYVAAYGTIVALAEYVRRLGEQWQIDAGRRHPLAECPDAAEAAAARDMATRLGVLEQFAATRVAPQAGPPTRHGPGLVPAGSRLNTALAGWDIQALRILPVNPDAPDLIRVARVRALIAAASGIVTKAAVDHRFADPELAQRLTPFLSGAEAAWHRAARWRGELTSRTSRTDPALVRPAGEVRAIAATACTQTR